MIDYMSTTLYRCKRGLRDKQGMGQEFRSVGSVCSIEESSGPQNPRVPIVLSASKSAGAKGDVPKIYGFVHPLQPC